MQDDQSTTLAELKGLVTRFRDDRDWKQFHNPKDLAAAISIEAAELLEIFLWKDPDQVDAWKMISPTCSGRLAVARQCE